MPRATPWEHLQLAARLRRLPTGWEARARALLERFDLGGAAHRVTVGFSHGMGRRTSVVLAAFHEPGGFRPRSRLRSGRPQPVRPRGRLSARPARVVR